MKHLLPFFCFCMVLCGCAEPPADQVKQLVLMVGSEASNFEGSAPMRKLSEGGEFGVGGEEWGGELTLFVDDQEVGKENSGGMIRFLDPASQTLQLQGEVTEDLYLGMIYQVIDRWPDDLDGVIILQKKVEAGTVNLSFELSGLVQQAEALLD